MYSKEHSSIPKANQTVEIKLPDSSWSIVKIISKAGKATGKYNNWLNVTDGSNDWSMDWSKVSEWKVSDNPLNPDSNVNNVLWCLEDNEFEVLIY